MTTLTDPLGAGTISYTTSQVVNEDYSIENITATANGTNYTFTAKDGRGYKFTHFDISVKITELNLLTQETREWTPVKTITANPGTIPISDDYYLLNARTFEGTVRETLYREDGTVYGDWLYTYSELAVTAVFATRTGRPIRNAAGTNLVRAASGLILVDA